MLAKLVKDYEKNVFNFKYPDPVETILFRMEQQWPRQRDIAHIAGENNWVSKILPRKRPLTLPMIRALYERLEILPVLLICEPTIQYAASEELQEAQIPIDLVKHRGWIQSGATISDLIKRFVAPAGSPVLLKHVDFWSGLEDFV